MRNAKKDTGLLVARLPEFKFWFSAQRAILFSIGSTFFQMFNVPVFWPILVVYFIVLFGVSRERQVIFLRILLGNRCLNNIFFFPAFIKFRIYLYL